MKYLSTKVNYTGLITTQTKFQLDKKMKTALICQFVWYRKSSIVVGGTGAIFGFSLILYIFWLILLVEGVSAQKMETIYGAFAGYGGWIAFNGSPRSRPS